MSRSSVLKKTIHPSQPMHPSHSSSLISSSSVSPSQPLATTTPHQSKEVRAQEKLDPDMPRPKAPSMRVPPNASCKLHTVKEDDKGDVLWSVLTCAFCMLEICFVYGVYSVEARLSINLWWLPGVKICHESHTDKYNADHRCVWRGMV
jgi:hypothetical protein